MTTKGREVKEGTLTGSFVSRDAARKALRALGRRGYRRAALIHKTIDGRVRAWDPFPLRRFLGSTLGAILLGGLAGFASLVFHRTGPIPSGAPLHLIPIMAGGSLGALFGAVWVRRSGYGVDRRFLESHARLLTAEETALILQAPIDAMLLPTTVLRESGEIPPAVFVLHPKRASAAEEATSMGPLLSPVQVREHARRLATDHKVDPEPRRNTRMLERLERARDSEAVWRYGVEPCVVSADVYGLSGRVRHGGWSWYTGSAAWMYRAWVEEILGMKVRGDDLRMDPVVPGWWDGFRLRYRRGEATYEMQVENPDGCERGVSWVEMDGRRLREGLVVLERGLVKHRIVVRMGKPEQAV